MYIVNKSFFQIVPLLGNAAQQPCLSAVLSGRSWLFLHLIGQNPRGWLTRGPEKWQHDEDYRFACSVAKSMLVVNDCAERNIKNITDYIRFTRNVNVILDDIVLVVEDRRSLVPNLNRENLMNA